MDIYFRAILFWLIFVNHEICSSNVRLIMLVDEAVSKGTRYAKYTELANAQLVISSYSMMLTVAISRLRQTVSLDLGTGQAEWFACTDGTAVGINFAVLLLFKPSENILASPEW